MNIIVIILLIISFIQILLVGNVNIDKIEVSNDLENSINKIMQVIIALFIIEGILGMFCGIYLLSCL